MSILLDIFGSIVIAGMLFMLIIKLNLFSSQTSYTSDNELKLIQNTKTLSEILDYDLRKIGYRSDSTTKITTAKIQEIEFYADIDRSVSVDVIKYWVDPSPEAGYIILKRTINNSDTMSGPSLGLDSIKFSYLTASQNIMTYTNAFNYPDSIRYIKTEMWVQSTYAVKDAFSNDSTFSKTYWEFTINPRNL